MTEVQRILRDAIDLARSRNARLVALTIHGKDGVDVIARAVLADLGLADVEVSFERGAGSARLGVVEMLPRAPALDVVSGSARNKP